jgi:Fe-S-cluster containining protein
VTAAIRIPAGLKWSCHGCGDCCTGHDIGPVEPEVIAGLEAANIAGSWAPAADGWHTARTGPDGQQATFLRQVDGACVFLRPDRQCAVHALLGAAAKPGFCREFPYNLVEDPAGTAAVVRVACAGFHRSFRDGDTVAAADVADVAALARVVPRTRFAPDRVAILPEQAIALPDWMKAEAAVLADLADRDEDPRALVAAMRRQLGLDLPVQPPQYDAAIAALCQALAHVMRNVLAGPPGPPHQVAFAERAFALLENARTAAPAPLDAEARAWSNLLLRSAILGKQWAAWGSVAAGIGVWLLGVEIARRNAPGTPEGLAGPLAAWERFTAVPLVQLWLNKARAATVDAFRHA